MNSWLEENLICPVEHTPLTHVEGILLSPNGRRYPVVEGIPVMLVDDVEQTLGVISASIKRARGEDTGDPRAPELYLESLGISEDEKDELIQWLQASDSTIDPVVAYLIGATSGYSYKHLIGNLQTYPIPELRLPQAKDKTLLDIGCNWGRWSIAAAQAGYNVVGIDPSLGAVMAARRVAQQLQLPITFVVADARFLPFRESSFDTVFSYSVLQHFSKNNVRTALQEAARVLRPGGMSMIQMPNLLGIRCLQHQLKRKFREARDFEVRYWSVQELKRAFDATVGPSSISVDCYFGLGLQKSDRDLMSRNVKLLIDLSEFLRSVSTTIPLMQYGADSLYVTSTRTILAKT